MQITNKEIVNKFKKDMTDMDFVYEQSAPIMEYLKNNQDPETMVIISSTEVKIMDLVIKAIEDETNEEE